MTPRSFFPYFRPAALALLPAIGFFLLLPGLDRSHYLRIESTHTKTEDIVFYFEDLDGDGDSELIQASHNSRGQPSITVYRDWADPLDQWNLKGSFINRNKEVYFPDLDGDGIKEVLSYTLAADSIFFNAVKPFSSKENAIISICRYPG